MNIVNIKIQRSVSSPKLHNPPLSNVTTRDIKTGYLYSSVTFGYLHQWIYPGLNVYNPYYLSADYKCITRQMHDAL